MKNILLTIFLILSIQGIQNVQVTINKKNEFC